VGNLNNPESMSPTLQLQPFLPPVPWQLPALAVGIGFVLMFAGISGSLAAGNSTHWRELYSTERFLIVGLLTVGILFAAIPAFRSRGLLWYYAMLLVMVGRGIEGALIVRFFTKVFSFVYMTSNRSLRDRIVQKFKDRVVRITLTSFVTIMMALVIASAFIMNSTLEALRWTAIAYTMGRFGIVSISVIYQLKDVVDYFEMLNPRFGWFIISGLVLAIAGAEVFDFPPFFGFVQVPTRVLESPTGEFVVRFAGFVGLLVGMLVAFIFFRMYATRSSQTGSLYQ
jgi:hypothetical protein